MAVIDGEWLSKAGLTYFWSKIKSIFTKQTETNVIANLGAKNLLKITASSGALNTATIAIADDGSIHITGQPTSNSAYVLSSGIELVIPENTYVLSMGAEAGNTKMSLSLRRKGTTKYVDLYHAESRIIPSGTYDRLHVYLYADTVYDTNVYPMIRRAEITDSTFEPYAKTNVDLTNENVNQQLEIDYAINTGAKNFLDVQHPTTTTRTSYTPLANGGVELSCSSAIWTSYNIADIPVEAGKEYIITFLLDELSGTSNFYFFLRNDNSSGTNLATKNYGSTTGIYEASFTPNTSVIWLGIYLNNSATKATATAKLRCMIRPAAITDDTFVPYAPTNRELYEMILSLQSGVSAQSAASLMQAGRLDAELTDAQEVTDDATQSGTSTQSLNSPLTLNLDRNDLNESLDTNFDLIDSIPEEEEGDIE